MPVVTESHSITQVGGFVVLVGYYKAAYGCHDNIEFDIHMPLLYKHRTAALWRGCRQTAEKINNSVWHVPEKLCVHANAATTVSQDGLKTTLLRGCKFAEGQKQSLESLGVEKQDAQLLTTMATHVRFGCSWYVDDLCVFLRQALRDPDIGVYAAAMMASAYKHFPNTMRQLELDVQGEEEKGRAVKRANAAEAMLQRAYATLKDLGMPEAEINQTLAPPVPDAGTPANSELPKT